MPHIEIISGSVRDGRNSHRVSQFFQKFITENKVGTSSILDLKEYNFPVFEERLRLQKNPSPVTKEFAEKIKNADGIIIVTPEYNGSYPASVKNVIDLLYDEWHRKPVGIATVSAGDFAGTQAITSLQFSLWKIRAWVVPAMFPVAKVQDAFDEAGDPKDKAGVEKRANLFVNELLWCIEAKSKMNK
jgi:NAD(P)H-dependent FMN reductase